TLLGFAPGRDEAVAALQAVGLSPRPHGDAVEGTVPSWRGDPGRGGGLVEEGGRALGCDPRPLPAPAPAPRPRPRPPPRHPEAVGDRLSAVGFHEAFSYAMIGAGEDDPFVPDGEPEPLAIDNPISDALSTLRRSLAPGLVQAAGRNARRGAQDVRLFEVGRVF